MNYVLYIDVFFCINFCMDLLLLLLLRRISKSNTKKYRCVLAAAAGALYACIFVMMPLHNIVLNTLVTYMGIGFLMVLISQGFVNIKRCIMDIATLFILTFFLTGIMNALYYYTRAGTVIRNILLREEEQIVKLRIFIIITVISYIIIRFSMVLYEKYKTVSNCIYKVVLVKGKNKKTLNGFLDTGNSLREPISGKAVCIVEKEIILELLEDCEENKGYRIIPFHSIGEDSGIMEGYMIDYLIVLDGEKTVKIDKPVLGMYEHKLSEDGTYEMLLHPQLLM